VSDVALSFVLVIGAITAFFMGLIGMVQNDIKRVVAYSTLSQLGYMTVALGASAYAAGIFHLMTHAFFKALLFLAAGSVIIAMHHEQDMRRWAGCASTCPSPTGPALVGSLALIGFPGFSGFFSKDGIIEAVAHSTTPGAGLPTCWCCWACSSRRCTPSACSSWCSTAGAFRWPWRALPRPGTSTCAGRPSPPAVKARFGWLYRVLDRKYGFDEFNAFVFAGGSVGLGRILWRFGDVLFIDGCWSTAARGPWASSPATPASPDRLPVSLRLRHDHRPAGAADGVRVPLNAATTTRRSTWIESRNQLGLINVC
jgi:NADH:ubiquinone oxidoreductase subunit 5 (subunit L)/multisubunit Na+/H+ antiporter MnhA subunit